MASGIRIFACEATLNYYNPTEDDLAFGVETASGVAAIGDCKRAKDGVTSSSDESHSSSPYWRRWLPARPPAPGRLCRYDGPQRLACTDHIYSPKCGACRQFDREGPIYNKTAESLRHWSDADRRLASNQHQLTNAPRRRSSARRLFADPDRQELDRIIGYSDAELFWLGHRRMMNRIGSDQ